MSATSAPFGLRPAFHPSGLDRAVALTDGISSTYGFDILKGQPVKLDTAVLSSPPPQVTLSSALLPALSGLTPLVVAVSRTTRLPLRLTRLVRALLTSTTILRSSMKCRPLVL